MSEISTILQLARDCGFSQVGELAVGKLEFLPEVRDMCSADRCHNYNKCWTCPPHCGTLEEIAAKAATYRRGVLLQSTGQMEDDFDVETLMETGELQKERFNCFVEKLRVEYPNCLPMSSGGCTVCANCTCPDEPCRFPEKAIPSMEAYGLVVSQVCQDSGLPYYYGPQTITYSSCVLID